MVTKPQIKDRREEYAFHDDIVYLHEGCSIVCAPMSTT